jgi:hypothetical protein
MILDGQFNTRTLPCDQYTANDSTLDPYLSILSNDDTLRLDPRKILFEGLHDVDFLFIGHEPFLALPRDGNGSAYFVPDTGESSAEADGRRGGWWEGETEKEGGLATAGLVVGSWERRIAGSWMGFDRVGGRKTWALEETAGLEERGCRRMVSGREL